MAERITSADTNVKADIDWRDVMQSGASTYRGSLGIAQIHGHELAVGKKAEVIGVRRPERLACTLGSRDGDCVER